MPQENVEIVARAYDAFRRRDVDALREVVHPDIAIQMRREVPEGPITFRGLEGAREVWEALDATFAEYRWEPVEVTPTGNCVVVHGRQSGRFAGGGLRVEGDIFHAWWIRDGRAVGMRHYSTRSEALEAVGLSGQAVSQENADQWDLAEAGFGALNSGDLDAFLALTAEDVEFTSMVAEAEGTTFRGHDGVRAWWETVRGAFEDVRWKLLGLRGSGDRGVIHFRMTGTLGSVPVEQTMWQAVVLRDGKLIWWAFFRSEREALEAVGLSE
jgi:ketosteroid isomerase-like protein